MALFVLALVLIVSVAVLAALHFGGGLADPLRTGRAACYLVAATGPLLAWAVRRAREAFELDPGRLDRVVECIVVEAGLALALGLGIHRESRLAGIAAVLLFAASAAGITSLQMAHANVLGSAFLFLRVLLVIAAWRAVGELFHLAAIGRVAERRRSV